MRIIADFHIHSKYSRATSKDMTARTIALWADKKGINIIASGDFQHPKYLAELKTVLEAAEPGLYKIKKERFASRIVLSTEIANIYKQGGKVRKVHTLVVMPSLEAAEKFSKKLDSLGNIKSDGRPIFGFPTKDLVKIAKDICADSMIIPAHVWTPWFSVFGSKSGFDSLEECFEEQTKHIKAIETGLSSDVLMNRRVSALDNIALISNSDAHSPRKIGREANVFETDLDYYKIKKAIETRDLKRFLYTLEFFPEEGKYHNDGHRLCKVNLSPREALANNNLCPVCLKRLTLGVLHRVEVLADRPLGYKLDKYIPQKHLVPLEELIAAVYGVAPSAKKVQTEYIRMLQVGGTEFELLLDKQKEALLKITEERITEAILKVRSEMVNIIPGYDGEFGKILVSDKKKRVAGIL